MARLSVSRVLAPAVAGEELIIYLGLRLPAASSGSYGAPSAGHCEPLEAQKARLLAADRVYRLPWSPMVDAGSYPARFTLTADAPRHQ